MGLMDYSISGRITGLYVVDNLRLFTLASTCVCLPNGYWNVDKVGLLSAIDTNGFYGI